MAKYKLILGDIGKFKDKNFDLHDVTIFYGPNEAGKTTIIDALVHCLAEYNKKNSLHLQILSPRYAGKINSKLKHDGTGEEVKKIDHDLVKNLLLVRTSTLDLEFPKSGESWVDEVRDKLFTGGVNPQAIINAVNEMDIKKSDKSNSPLFENKKVEKTIADLKLELENTKSEISAHASTIQKQADLSKDEIGLEKKRQDISVAHKAKEDLLKHKKKLLERKDIYAVQQKVSERTKLHDKISKLTSYTDATYNKIKAEDEKVKSLVGKRETYRQELEKKEKTFEDSKLTIEKFEASLEKVNAHYELASKTQMTLEGIVSQNEAKKSEKPTGMFVVALVLLAAGIGILMTLASPLNFSGFALVLAAAGVLWKAINGEKKEDNMIKIRTEIRFFNSSYNLQPACPETSFDAASDFLRRLINSTNESKNKLQSFKDNVKANKTEFDGYSGELKALEGQMIAQAETLRSALPHGVPNVEEYFKLLQESKSGQTRLQTIDEELKAPLSKYGHSTLQELIQYLEHKIIEINNTPMPDEPVSHKDLIVLEQDIATLSSERDQVITDLGKVGKDLSGTNVQIQLELNRLSEKQVKLQKDLKIKEARRDELLLQMDSFRLIKSLVEEIAEDTSAKFSVLSDSINKYMSVILDNHRPITFKSMDDMKNIQCADHYGTPILATQLSSGTRDAFVLSTRLALLEKVNLPKDAFLILDDPFVLMDKPRQEKAIKAIKQFHDELKLPVVFFTKDEGLRDQIQAEFASAALVELIR